MLFLAFNENEKPIVSEKNRTKFIKENNDKKLAYVLAHDICNFIKCTGAISFYTADQIFEIDLKNMGVPKREYQKYKDMIIKVLEKEFNVKVLTIDKDIDYNKEEEFLKEYAKQLYK